MPGQLVISLDFELMWGVRDSRNISDYGDAVLGAREAIPRMLERFRSREIRATWATVGLLFARNRAEILDYIPEELPTYLDSRSSPYPFIFDGLGKDESEDPWHFGRSLVDRIIATPGQEIASHTFSHYYCLEPGQSRSAFAADLRAACSIASTAGQEIKSIVFPRNQVSDEYISEARALGILAYRGASPGFANRPREKGSLNFLIRGTRLIESISPVSWRNDYERPLIQDGMCNVPASRFLRSWNPRFELYSHLHISKIKQEMTQAARDERIYHLWWHPHNFGRNTRKNLQVLDELLDMFEMLRVRYGMENSSMYELSALQF